MLFRAGRSTGGLQIAICLRSRLLIVSSAKYASKRCNFPCQPDAIGDDYLRAGEMCRRDTSIRNDLDTRRARARATTMITLTASPCTLAN